MLGVTFRVGTKCLSRETTPLCHSFRPYTMFDWFRHHSHRVTSTMAALLVARIRSSMFHLAKMLFVPSEAGRCQTPRNQVASDLVRCKMQAGGSPHALGSRATSGFSLRALWSVITCAVVLFMAKNRPMSLCACPLSVRCH